MGCLHLWKATLIVTRMAYDIFNEDHAATWQNRPKSFQSIDPEKQTSKKLVDFFLSLSFENSN